jgi:hypothetical protein
MLLVACAGAPQSIALLESYVRVAPAFELGDAVNLTDVSFNPQEDYQCGPAAIATVLQYSGINISSEAMVEQVYLPSRQGSLQPEMLAAPRRYDRISYLLPPKLEGMLREVQANRPVLVMQNLGLTRFPQWHYAVVVGYDLKAKDIILRSGTIEEYRLSLATFERTWQRGSHWAFIVLEPGELPVGGDASRYMEAMVGFERGGSREAVLKAYRAGLKKWPNEELLGIAYGNQLLELEQFSEAVQAYTAVLDIHTDSAAAHNNLAYALARSDRLGEALFHAKRAITLGGNLSAHYAETLNSIETIIEENDAL